jgi:hypothetical protein
VLPQPSGTSPQSAFCCAHVFDWHRHDPFVHARPAGQLPQSSAPLQPLFTVPHVAWTAAHVVGVHAHLPPTHD